jgi:anthranilate phosphoribosyltransferase
MKEVLQKVTGFGKLSKQEARQVLTSLAKGEYNDGQVAAFITTYMMRSITIEELQGFREAMLDLCIHVDLSEFDPMDLCGTGGDGKNTFNISTLASFVTAGAGIPVAKHGNYGVSSVCGSSNVLAHLGYNFTNDIDLLKRQIDKAGICFLHAPLFHPAMKNVAPIRKELGVKTFFNMLGPLVNPAMPSKQIIGVFNLKLARVYGYLHQRLDKKYGIIHAMDGYDEISLSGDFKLITESGEFILSPADIGLNSVSPDDIYGGETIDEAAEIFYKVLNGEGSDAQNDVVIANAGAAISTYTGNELLESIELARESLESGRAKKAFETLVSPDNNPITN